MARTSARTTTGKSKAKSKAATTKNKSRGATKSSKPKPKPKPSTNNGRGGNKGTSRTRKALGDHDPNIDKSDDESEEEGLPAKKTTTRSTRGGKGKDTPKVNYMEANESESEEDVAASGEESDYGEEEEKPAPKKKATSKTTATKKGGGKNKKHSILEEVLDGSPSAITQFTQKFANEEVPKKKGKGKGKKTSKKAVTSDTDDDDEGVDVTRESFVNLDGEGRPKSSKVEFEEDYAANAAVDWRYQGVIDW